jgi:hypothetical protein
MTPKEKAEQLFNQYANVIYDRALTVKQYEICKECALIAVDEILNLMNRSIDHFVPHFGGGGHTIKMPNQEYQYWQEVKQEIEKL